MALPYPIVHCPPAFSSQHMEAVASSGLQSSSWLSCPNILRQPESKSLRETGLPGPDLGSWLAQTFLPAPRTQIWKMWHTSNSREPLHDQQTYLHSEIKEEKNRQFAESDAWTCLKMPSAKILRKQKWYRPALTPLSWSVFCLNFEI